MSSQMNKKSVYCLICGEREACIKVLQPASQGRGVSAGRARYYCAYHVYTTEHLFSPQNWKIIDRTVYDADSSAAEKWFQGIKQDTEMELERRMTRKRQPEKAKETPVVERKTLTQDLWGTEPQRKLASASAPTIPFKKRAISDKSAIRSNKAQALSPADVPPKRMNEWWQRETPSTSSSGTSPWNRRTAETTNHSPRSSCTTISIDSGNRTRGSRGTANQQNGRSLSSGASSSPVASHAREASTLQVSSIMERGKKLDKRRKKKITGNESRDGIILKLTKALLKKDDENTHEVHQVFPRNTDANIHEVMDRHASSETSRITQNEEVAEKVAEEIEKSIFSHASDEKNKYYKDKVVSLIVHLNDSKNATLRRNVIKGIVPPSVLVNMSSEQLANEDVKQEIERLRSTTSGESDAGWTNIDRLCEACGGRNSEYLPIGSNIDSRKAEVWGSKNDSDSVMFRCQDCHHEWTAAM